MYNDYMSLINTSSGPYVTSASSNTSVTGPLVKALNSIGTETLAHEPAMNLKIHKAVGGFVLEVINYNSSDYLPKSKLYVADETNIGNQIEKILLLETIKG
jgi:hypothetical protein